MQLHTVSKFQQYYNEHVLPPSCGHATLKAALSTGIGMQQTYRLKSCHILS